VKRSSLFALTLTWGLTLALLWTLVIVPVVAGSPRPAPRVAGSTSGEYGPDYPLDTAPIRQWHTFMGGSSNDRGYDIALDKGSNVYIAGSSYTTTTWGSPINAPAGEQDGFVVKLDSDGARQWNTFLGSAEFDDAYGIAVDGSGNVYVVGSSDATWGSPIKEHAEKQDGFVAKLNSAGALQWVTFLGGSGDDAARSISLDGSGNVYVVGTAGGTWGSPVDPYPGDKWYAPFVAKLDSSGALQWHTFWGAGGLDTGEGIAVDSGGNVYVVGTCYDTWGSPVDPYTGGTEACAAKLNTNGARQWNTFLGSPDPDGGYGIGLDESGGVYVTGYSYATWGAPLDPHGGPHYDVFVARLNASDGARQWNTFLGFSTTSYGYDVAVDRFGRVYVTGDTITGYGVYDDAFLTRLDGDGSWHWNEFIGKTNDHDYGRGVVSDATSHVYVAGFSSSSWGVPIDGYSGGWWDALAVKFEIPLYADLAITKSATPRVTDPGGAITYELTFSNAGHLTATGVLITDTVPALLTDVAYIGSGAVITPTGGVLYTWQVQDLAPGQGGAITVTGIVSPSLPPGKFIDNTATITTTAVDGNHGNNASSVGVMIPSAYNYLPLVTRD
jgi:uncharacterized repeat protein (TIGR01451 family)